MSNPAARELADEVAKLSRRLQRERKTRLTAEQIAETGLRELYEKQQQLQVLEKIPPPPIRPLRSQMLSSSRSRRSASTPGGWSGTRICASRKGSARDCIRAPSGIWPSR